MQVSQILLRTQSRPQKTNTTKISYYDDNSNLTQTKTDSLLQLTNYIMGRDLKEGYTRKTKV